MGIPHQTEAGITTSPSWAPRADGPKVDEDRPFPLQLLRRMARRSGRMRDHRAAAFAAQRFNWGVGALDFSHKGGAG